ICKGSLMVPKALTRFPSDTSPAANILTQAISFINHSKKEEHLARVDEVTREVETTGSYQLTTEELTFGAKQAWRNAPRCIGRIQWSNLQLFDARKCRTTKEMFEYLCAHIKFATDGGNIRSTITVFPQRTDGQHDFRIWNSQLIRYAGYQMEDGTVIGDPVNVEFTEICTQLGWTPKYGSFDVLPLILEANGEDPELFEIPPELVLEVQMEHPRYEWFKELNLRWYALPAVANMLLEIGGLEFTACPFNGWYMSTEIGVRDFCDPQRYNIVERVGRCMGLETHRLSSLWKNEALVAINIAVIHSFQKNKVTIIDHHSATESFMHHMENEVRLRGGCPADWIWLVPPMSGSLTPVFHQEMISYILSPFFYYQVSDERFIQTEKKKKITFDALAKAVVFSQMLMQRALLKRVPCTILYATETGKSQTFAKKLKSVLSCALNPRLLCMEDYNFAVLEKEHLLLVVTSTFGNGDSPGNGEVFKFICHLHKHTGHSCIETLQLMGMKSLSTSIRLVQKDIKRINSIFRTRCMTNHFPPHRYGVFGLGSCMYPHFCAFSRTVDAKLAELGAKCVTSTGEGDELNGQHSRLVRPRSPLTVNYGSEKKFCVLCIFTALSALHSKAVLPLTLKYSAILVELETVGGKQVLNYAPGDHVGVFPENSSELVTGILKHVTNAPHTNQSLRLENLPAFRGAVWQTDEHIPACTLTQALTYLLDINTPPSQGFLRKLSQMTKEQNDQQRLLALASVDRYSHLLTYTDILTPAHLHRQVLTPAHLHRHSHTCSPTQTGTHTWSPVLAVLSQACSFTAGLKWSPMMLVFGCHDPDTDHLYKDQTSDMKTNGTLQSITTAPKITSHLQLRPLKTNVYVQHVLKKQLSKEVMQVLHQSHGHLYVCGGMNMAQDVAHTIQEILASELNITFTEAGEYLQKLKSEKRYHIDIFGS
uniref:Nitric oxide synthase, inducible n=1 Tax=Electrophorus electricus TaxID=8005 RepID=A0A4W4EZ30_ELEEL